MTEMIHRRDFIVPDKFDGKAIPVYVAGLQSGVNLDMTGYPLDYIRAGSLVIKDASGFKPAPIEKSGEEYVYSALPEGAEYVGVVVNTKPKEEPLVGVMTQGVVITDACLPTYSTELKATLKTALKIEFR